jgi:chromosome segregation ATPase
MVEQFKRERQEREALEREVMSLRREMNQLVDEKERFENQIERLFNERDTIKLKIEAMLDAISVVDPEAAEALKR